ncbi:hypothetical protein BR93DRAFT_927539 [Coniochaeta sp. PMI_546]|nr:hypothetical protein BR93DRAFT_927539 [Coniochaeta sp. PMI_546]
MTCTHTKIVSPPPPRRVRDGVDPRASSNTSPDNKGPPHTAPSRTKHDHIRNRNNSDQTGYAFSSPNEKPPHNKA